MTKKERLESVKLFESLSPTLKTIAHAQLGITIPNTSNASTYVDLLKEEFNELVQKPLESK